MFGFSWRLATPNNKIDQQFTAIVRFVTIDAYTMPMSFLCLFFALSISWLSFFNVVHFSFQTFTVNVCAQMQPDSSQNRMENILYLDGMSKIYTAHMNPIEKSFNQCFSPFFLLLLAKGISIFTTRFCFAFFNHFFYNNFLYIIYICDQYIY